MMSEMIRIARLGRIDIGVADHELLEDVVLNGPRQHRLVMPLFLPGDDETRQNRDHRAVHGHRDRPCPAGCRRRGSSCPRRCRWPRPPCPHRPPRADGRCHSRGAWPDRRRPTRPAARRPAPCDRRRSTPRRSKTPHIAGSSRAGRVHRGLHPARERCRPRRGAHMRQALDIGLGIERLDADAFQRVPGQAVGVAPLQFLFGAFTPFVGDLGVVRHRVVPFLLLSRPETSVPVRHR
jgi:hypothetical protein